jgi:hypothetical protein
VNTRGFFFNDVACAMYVSIKKNPNYPRQSLSNDIHSKSRLINDLASVSARQSLTKLLSTIRFCLSLHYTRHRIPTITLCFFSDSSGIDHIYVMAHGKGNRNPKNNMDKPEFVIYEFGEKT